MQNRVLLLVLTALIGLPGVLMAGPKEAPRPSAPAGGSAARKDGGAKAHANKSTEQLLDAADAACKSLDYDVCVDFATLALGRPDITETQQARAYTTQGAAFAVVGQTVEAERPYRLLLRIRPDFDMPKDTPPKILAVFRKVQAEENEIRQAVKEAARRKIIQSIKIQVDAPNSHKGGTPLQFFANVTDPLKGIATLALEYRLDPDQPYGSMPFQTTPLGPVAEFSGAQMSTDQPLKLQYMVVAKDVEGQVLVTVFTQDKPGMVDVEAGQVAGPPIYKQPSFVFITTGGAAGLVLGGVVLTAVLIGLGGTGLLGAFIFNRGDGLVPTEYGAQRL